MSTYTKKGTDPGTLLLAAADIALLVFIIISALNKDDGPSQNWQAGLSHAGSAVSEYSGGFIVSDEESEYPEGLLSLWEEPLTMADFSWYEDDFRLNGFLPDDVFIYDPARLAGDWKGYIKYDPNNETGMRSAFLFYAAIIEDGSRMDLAVDWYWTNYNDEAEGHYQEGSAVYTGSFAGEEYHAEGTSKVIIRRFFQRGDRQYGVGMIESADGMRSILCLVRPAEV